MSEVGAFAPEHCPGAAVPPREDSVFQPGAHNPLVRFGDQSGAVSICADSLHHSHPQRAAELGAKTYFSSQFAIPLHVEPKLTLLKKQAVRFGMTIVFSNFGGPTGGLASGGRSRIWSEQAECVAQLGASGSGLAIGIQDGAGWRARRSLSEREQTSTRQERPTHRNDTEILVGPGSTFFCCQRQSIARRYHPGGVDGTMAPRGSSCRSMGVPTMTIRFVSRVLGLSICTTLMLSACDDDSGGSKPKDAGMDASDEEDAGDDVEDTSTPRDAGRDTGTDSAAAPDAADPYTCVPPPPPDGTIAVGEPCCEGLGVCIELTDDAGASLGYGDCNAAENLRCLPNTPSGDGGVGDGGVGDAGTADAGPGGLVRCRMIPAGTPDGGTDYEGRCLPECLTRGNASLTQGACADDFVCVPCYNLITGASTGACNTPGDAPVEAAPDGFDECGEELGYCVGTASVGDAGATLPQLTCDEEELCVPKQRVTQPGACSARCESIVGAGACTPAFVVPEAQRGFLTPASCETGELCVPCINPTTSMPTGACR
jgi:hypothetical protein